jgi:hypothetical protein
MSNAATNSLDTPLAPPSANDILGEIVGHLHAAIVQSIQSDDQIIMEHIRVAHEMAKLLWTANLRAQI